MYVIKREADLVYETPLNFPSFIDDTYIPIYIIYKIILYPLIYIKVYTCIQEWKKTSCLQ